MFKDDKIDIGGAGSALDVKIAKRVFRELEIYLNKPIEKISQEYWGLKEAEEAEKQKRIANAETIEEVLNYYRTTDYFLYELIYWEALKSKQTEFRKLYYLCRKMKIDKLVDFGGGVGGLSIFMASWGLRCDYLDVPGKTFDFAKWRFKRRNLEIQLYSDAGALPLSRYDGVVAYDVLEHLFNIEEVIEKINQTLKSGGYFISRSTFNEEGLHLPKNKKFQDITIFNALMEKNNFIFLGQLKPNYLSQFLKYLGFKYALFGVRIKQRLKYGGNFIIYKKSR